MRKLGLISLIITAFFVVAATAAVAASVHYKKGSPVLSDGGLVLNAAAQVSGLGNGDLVVSLTVADAQPVSTCTNPAGKTQPPGQNPARADVGGLQAIPGSAVKNGNASFNVTTGAPVSPIPGAPDCPNSGWTENITDMIFFGLDPPAVATIEIFQGIGCAIDDNGTPTDPSDDFPNANCVLVFTSTHTL
jgi:hypothetical protein